MKLLPQATLTEMGLTYAADQGLKVSAANTILSPGKFEGEHVSTLYFYEAYLDGDGIVEEESTPGVVFKLTDAERIELGNPPWCNDYRLLITDDGFVHGNV